MIRSSLLFFVLCLFVSVTASGCASRSPEANRTVRVAVLDGAVDYESSRQGEIIDEGWWLGARDRYLNTNTGVKLGDSIAREIGRIPGVEVYSREDLAIYMAQKERLLRRNYPLLTSAQRKDILNQHDPADYGKSLNVDYVVTSELLRSSTVINRTFSWWYSNSRAVVDVYDVRTGERVWSRELRRTKLFSSQIQVFQSFGRKVAKNFRKEDVFGTQLPEEL